MGDPAISSQQPAYNTGQLRYDFQIACARRHPGVVLNVGCNEDPVGLKHRWEDRVINCDMEGWDKHMKRPNIVDRIFNALDCPWPFDAEAAELVILGDILEHFPVEESGRVAREAARIAPKVCITVPEDTRIDEAAEHAKWVPENYNLHTTVVTREKLDEILCLAKLQPVWLVEGPWGFDNITGFCVLAERIPGSESNPFVVSLSELADIEPPMREPPNSFGKGGVIPAGNRVLVGAGGH